MFNHQNGVTPIPQRLEGINQDPIVSGMQADGGFI